MKRHTLAEQAMRRRFALLALLHKRPHTYQEIVAELERQRVFSYDHAESPENIAQQRKYQFRHDLLALRHQYHIHFDKKSQRYVWYDSPFHLFLEEGLLEALALLLDTFIDSHLPHADAIRQVLQFFVQQLSPEQQGQLRQLRNPFVIDLHETTDYRDADPKVVHDIELAIKHRRQLNFRYSSPHHDKVFIHTIEPDALEHKNGHVYLVGIHVFRNSESRYRLDNIVRDTTKVLPKTFTHSHAPRPYQTFCYHLSPALARRSVSQHFDDQTIEQHADGSATVIAKAAQLFDARRILLSYGEHCTVLDPPELIEQMRVVAHHYNKSYLSKGE